MNETKFLAKVLVEWTKEYANQKGASYVVKMGYKYLTRWHEYLKNRTIMASEEAEKEFERVFGLGHNLRKLDWNARLNPQIAVKGAKTSKKGPEKFNKIAVRSILHWEHFDTAFEFEQYLVDLYNQSKLTVNAVESKLKTLRICWVTKEENNELNENKYSSRRPDPIQAYKDCGIVYK